MLQHEDITKVQELKGKFDKVWISSEYLQAHLNTLGFNKIKRQFSWCKQAGYSFESLIATLLILPLIGVHSIYELTTSKGEFVTRSQRQRELQTRKIHPLINYTQPIKQSENKQST